MDSTIRGRLQAAAIMVACIDDFKDDEEPATMDDLGARLRAADPDVVLIVGDDQREWFFEDTQPAFAIYCGDSVQNLTWTDAEREERIKVGISPDQAISLSRQLAESASAVRRSERIKTLKNYMEQFMVELPDGQFQMGSAQGGGGWKSALSLCPFLYVFVPFCHFLFLQSVYYRCDRLFFALAKGKRFLMPKPNSPGGRAQYAFRP